MAGLLTTTLLLWEPRNCGDPAATLPLEKKKDLHSAGRHANTFQQTMPTFCHNVLGVEKFKNKKLRHAGSVFFLGGRKYCFDK